MSEPALETLLATHFGFQAFRPGQRPVVDALVAGRDVLAVMPTGAGKSLCYQLPAIARQGLAVVVSPLIALMQDQVQRLVANGIAAETINSSRSREENVAAWRAAASGAARLLYMSPERLTDGRMLDALARLPVSLLVVDEAHCISQWGHDFRPDYMTLSCLRDRFEGVPIGAFTATADRATRTEIARILLRSDPAVFVAGFDRPNIRLQILRKEKGQKDLLASLVDRYRGESGIVYCLSRAETEKVASSLAADGVNAFPYHAGMEADARRASLDRFLTEPGAVTVATIAFGMGIDKPDVRFVIHAALPSGIEAYYQEIGRAGRDGGRAEASLLFGWNDVMARRRMIDQGQGGPDRQKAEHRRLRALLDYVEADGCRRVALLRHFGEDTARCGNCDGCAPSAPLAGRDAPRRRLAATLPSDIAPELLAALKTLRLELARARKVPAYVVFTDATLTAMAASRPATSEDLAAIPGVGARKLADFGPAFLELIRSAG